SFHQTKAISGTFLEKFFSVTQNKFNAIDKEHWLTWKSALDKRKHNICIKLEAPKNEESKWIITILKKDKNDSSKHDFINDKWEDCLNDLGIALRIYPELEKAFYKDKIIPFELKHEEVQVFLKETAWVLQ